VLRSCGGFKDSECLALGSQLVLRGHALREVELAEAILISKIDLRFKFLLTNAFREPNVFSV
jgi:hypothetical protein